MQHGGRARLEAAEITAREAEILAAVGRRLSNQEIADRMFISKRTVESHISALLRKLAIPDRPGLVDLAQQLAGEPVLPEPVTSFVGRVDELDEVADMLAVSPLVCLVGPGGCGKTRLALEAARRWRGQVRIVELAPAAAGAVSALVAGGLGVGYEAGDLVAAARVTLAGTEVLLVIDNCEHVAGAAGEVLGALAGSVPGLRVLATSRTPLGVPAEHVLPVRPLEVPTGTTPEDVRACAAGQLFLDRALAASPRFGLDEASAPYVAAICRRLDGLPLAIELGAARVRNLGVMELAEGLQYRLAALERPAGADRHRSLASAIAWSWQLLDDAERGLLRSLAVLPGEFTLALVEAIGPAGADVRPVLLRLVEQSLVSMRLPEGEPARYRLLEVIRAFAREQAGPATDEQVLKAHALFFFDVAADAVRNRFHPTPGTLARAGIDEPNLLAALAWSAAHDPVLADRLLISVSRLLEVEPSRHALELVRDLAVRCPPDWSSEALANAAHVVRMLSVEDAQQLVRNSRRAAASDRDEALAAWSSGWVHADRDQQLAVRCLDQAISYAAGAEDPWLEGSALAARGMARTNPQEAFTDWERAVTRYVIAGDLMHANNVRFLLAREAVRTRTRLDDVPIWLDESESYAASHGLTHEHAHVRLVRGMYQRIQGNPGQARLLLDAALVVFREAGDFRCIAQTLFELAQLSAAGDPAVTSDLLLRALRAAAFASGPAIQTQILAELVTAATAAGDLVLAARCLGALTALGKPAEHEATEPASAPLAAPAPEPTWPGPAYTTFVSEGRVGGIDLITALYPRWRLQLVRGQASCGCRAADQGLAAAVEQACLVLRAVVHDQCRSSNRQSIEPLIAASGYRQVQEALISCAETGSDAEAIGTAMAMCWTVRFAPSLGFHP
jgi:predicted ATPase/DNA-binding CsgD family transcriptional regulator